MGFGTGKFARVWEVSQITPNVTKGRISTMKKNRETGFYEQDFSAYVSFLGNAAATSAMALKEGAKIKINECEVSNNFNREKRVTYTTYKIYSFDEIQDQQTEKKETVPVSDSDGEVDMEIDDSNLPF